MIRPSYALKLANVKLRSKRGVLTASIVVASLLFAALIATVIVFTGAERSALAFTEKAGNNRYLVEVSPNIPNGVMYFPPPLSLSEINKIEAFQTQYYAALQAKYASLGLTFDKSSVPPALQPAAWMSATLPQAQRVTVNFSSPVTAALRVQQFNDYAKTAPNKLSDLKQIGSKYGATGYYIVDKASLLPTIPGLRLIQNGKENFGDSNAQTGGATPAAIFMNAIHNGSYAFTDQRLLSRYLLPTSTQDLKGIPVVVSAQEAAALFGAKVGIGKEPTSPGAIRAWVQAIQTKLNGQTYQVCYRNSAEQAELQKIQNDYADMQTNQNNPNYVKPSLIYGYPTSPCGDIVVKQDTRTAAEKAADAKTIEIQKELGTYLAPEQKLLTFQIVGIEYAQPYTDYSKSIDDYIKSLLVSQDSATTAAEIPIQMYNALPNSLKFTDIQNQTTALPQDRDDNFASRVLQFRTADEARAFLNNETCPASNSSCNKAFFGTPYGSNYLILDQVGELFGRIASIAFPAALGLAAVIIWFTISRIMAENRKETAVYRAMGAKRRDVTSIYIVYVLLVAVRIAVVSIVLGVVAAFVVNCCYAQPLTDTAVTAFGIINNAPKLSLFYLGSPLLLVIIGSIFVISLIASIQPLIRNVLRSPIRDIRDE